MISEKAFFLIGHFSVRRCALGNVVFQMINMRSPGKQETRFIF